MKANKALMGMLGGVLVMTLSGGIVYAQSTAEEQEPIVITNTDEQATSTATARQKVTKSLARLGLRLDWRKATLSELRKTQADLIAAGDDEDLRLRIVLAARLREHGVRVDWRKHSAETLMDRWETVAQTETDVTDEPTPTTRRRPRTAQNRYNESAPNIIVVPQPVVQPVYIEQPIYPVYGVITPPNFGWNTSMTVRTNDGLTITSYGSNYNRYPNCGPGNTTVNTQNRISLYPQGAARPGAIPLPRINNRQPDLGVNSVNF